MTPKEKAEELYFKYKEALNIRHDMRIGANPFAKQCALIAVGEIINAKTKILNEGDGWQLAESDTYWQEVKKEIELL